MRYFLTSSPCVVGACRFCNTNGFLDELRAALPNPCRAVYLCSSPDAPEQNDFYAAEMKDCFEAAGFAFTDYTLIDRRNQQDTAGLVRQADLLFLAGGHVPTQNRFFREIGLQELAAEFDGVVMGISAGSMNCADVVYAQPEEPGESIDPDFEKFLPGLGLTPTMLLPHYQMVKDNLLDGRRLYEDITYADSFGHRFYVLVDGSFILGDREHEELRGEAYLIEDGEIRQIGEEGDVLTLR